MLNKNSRKSINYFDSETLASDIKNRALKGAGVTVISQFLATVINTVGTIILARLLLPSDFGLVTMVTAFSLLFQNFGYNGFMEAIIQKDKINHDQVNALFWINFFCNTLLTLLFISLAPLFVWFYNEPKLYKITFVISLTIFFSGATTQHMALLQRNMFFLSTSVNRLIAVIFSVMVAIYLAYINCGYWAIVSRRVAIPLSMAIGAWIFCQWRPGYPKIYSGVKDMVLFAINTYGNFTVNYITRNIEKVLIGWRFSSQSLGYYDRAYHLFVLPVNQLTAPLSNVSLATLSRLRNDKRKYLRYYLKALSMMAFLGMLLSAVLTIIGNDLILLLLGANWQTTGLIFTAFGPGVGMILIYYTNGWIHLSLGHANRWFKWELFSSIFTIILFIIGLQFGPIGVAVAYTASFYILTLPALLYAGKPVKIKLGEIFNAIWRYYISACVSYGLCWLMLYGSDTGSSIFLNQHVFIRIIIASILSVTLYCTCIVFLHRSIQPFLDILSVISEMLPSFLKPQKRE